MADAAFIEAYARLRSGAKAYAELHPNATSQTCEVGAKVILRKPAVQASITKIQAASAIQAGCTLSDHLNTLAVLRNLAVKAGKFRDATYAEELRGRASGHYHIDVRLTSKLTPEVVKRVDFSDFSDDDLAKLRAGELTGELIARLSSSARDTADQSSG